MSPPARACARFGGFARSRWRIVMGGEGTRAKAANRRGANRGRPRRGAAFVRSDRGDRDDCGSCGSCGGARVRRDARPRRDVRFAFWRSNARHHSNPRETTPSAASPRSDIARVARLQVCGWASAFGAASARTHTRGRAAHASPLWARSIWKPNIEWRDICRCHGCGGRGRRSMPPAQQTRRTAAASERGGGGKASAHRTRRVHADRELRPSAVLLFRSRSR